MSCCKKKPPRAFCFVQYFETVSSEVLDVDEIYKSLNCLRLRSHRIVDDAKQASAKEYGLIPLKRIRGSVQTK